MQHILAGSRRVNGNPAPSSLPKRPKKARDHRRRLGQFERPLDIDIHPSFSKYADHIGFIFTVRFDGDDRVGLPLPPCGDGFDTRVNRPLGRAPGRDSRSNFNVDRAGLVLPTDEFSCPGNAAIMDRPRLPQGVEEDTRSMVTAKEENRFTAAGALGWPSDCVAPPPMRRIHGSAPLRVWRCRRSTPSRKT